MSLRSRLRRLDLEIRSGLLASADPEAAARGGAASGEICSSPHELPGRLDAGITEAEEMVGLWYRGASALSCFEMTSELRLWSLAPLPEERVVAGTDIAGLEGSSLHLAPRGGSLSDFSVPLEPGEFSGVACLCGFAAASLVLSLIFSSAVGAAGF